jgi:hypothetical protein
MNRFHTAVNQNNFHRSLCNIACKRNSDKRMSTIVLFMIPRLKSCSLIIEEKYCIIFTDQDETYHGFITIMNRLHTASNQQAKNVYHLLGDIAFMRNSQNLKSIILLFMFTRIKPCFYK